MVGINDLLTTEDNFLACLHKGDGYKRFGHKLLTFNYCGNGSPPNINLSRIIHICTRLCIIVRVVINFITDGWH